MAWTERQRTLLQAMGLRVWPLPGQALPAPAEAADPAVAAASAASPARTVAVAPMASSGAAAAAWRSSQMQPLAGARTLSESPPAAPIAADEVAALGWPALREAVSACRACGLCEGRTQTVFGTGHEQAHWLVVGEAPGEQEDRQGEPFVGAAGQLLDRMLAALQLARGGGGAPSQRVYIANTVKCRPPRNRNPSAEEMAACHPYLQRQIGLVRPRIILAMGRCAVQALLHSDEPLGRLRGRVHRFQNLPLVVTYHPAYLLRSPSEKARAWEDLCLAAATVAGAGP